MYAQFSFCQFTLYFTKKNETHLQDRPNNQREKVLFLLADLKSTLDLY